MPAAGHGANPYNTQMHDLPALDPPTQAPEWQRSGRYIVLAIGLHAVVLALPLGKALSEMPLPPLKVKLVETLRAAEPLPVAASDPQALARPSPAPPRKSQPAPRLRPVLAMTAQQQPVAAQMPTVPPPLPIPAVEAPSTPGAKIAPVAAEAAPTISAARFDAAYLQNPKPVYPPISRRLGEEGKVMLRVRVNADGHPAKVDLEKSSNFERLDEAARQTVARWRFVPAKRGDEAIETSVIVPIVFRLDG